MNSERQGQFPRWYYVFILLLVALSLITFNRSATGDWEFSLGIRETTAILVVLAILPFVLGFLSQRTGEGTVEIPGVGKFSWKNKSELDQEIDEKQKEHKAVGQAVESADPTKNLSDLRNVQQQADTALEKKVTLQDLPIVQYLYLQELHELVKKYNRNRHLRPSGKSTMGEADDIAYKMRTIAPLLFEQFSVKGWLDSSNPGKRLAAIKYLDWAQDVEFVDSLLDLLLKLKEDTFQQFHILLALSSMADQLAYDQRTATKQVLDGYKPDGDSSREFLKDRILKTLS